MEREQLAAHRSLKTASLDDAPAQAGRRAGLCAATAPVNDRRKAALLCSLARSLRREAAAEGHLSAK